MCWDEDNIIFCYMCMQLWYIINELIFNDFDQLVMYLVFIDNEI